MERLSRVVLAAVGVGVLGFLCLPIVIVIPMSFSSARALTFPPPGFSLRWYQAFFGDSRWMEAMWTSASVALLVGPVNSGAVWQADPAGRGQIWASPDWRVVWQRHNPSQGTDDPWPSANAWFSRAERSQKYERKTEAVWSPSSCFTWRSQLLRFAKIKRVVIAISHVHHSNADHRILRL